MENINCNSNLHNEDEVDCFIEENLVFSALNLVSNFPLPPQKSSAAQDQNNEEVLAFDQETRRIDHMIKELGDIVVDEKDQEISYLKCQLENKNTQNVQLEEKLSKLVDYITFMDGEFGSLMESILSLIKSGGNESFLYFGPFNKVQMKNEFVQILKDLSAQFLKDSENLAGTKKLMAKANSILKRMKKPSKNKRKVGLTVSNSSIQNDNQSHRNDSSLQDFNKELQYSAAFQAVSSTQDGQSANATVSTTVPLELTLATSSLSHPKIRRSTPSIIRTSMQNGFGRNLANVNKKHGIDHSKRHWGHFCLCRGTKFSSKSSLMWHIKNFTMDKKFECNICRKQYVYPSVLNAHMISSHKIESIIGDTVACKICKEKYRNYEEFCAHLKTYHHIEERVPPKHKSKNASRCENPGRISTPTPELGKDARPTLHFTPVCTSKQKAKLWIPNVNMY